ncbi:MAG: IS66 family insertion sequence element accessory protein TnpB [Polyangiaceae bacterium]
MTPVFGLSPHVRVYLASQRVDMRAGHDGLFAIVRSWDMNPFSGDLFAFIGKRGDRAKILVWHRGGFLLVYKRLEKGKFRIPAFEPGTRTAMLDATELAMLLDGIDVQHVKRPALWQPPGLAR